MDYVGLGNELAKAVAVRDAGLRKQLPADIEELFAVLAGLIKATMAPFAGIDRSAAGYEQLMVAQERSATFDARATFAEAFLRCEALFELLSPDARLRPMADDHGWLARVYASVRPSVDADALLWHRLGQKTRDLIGEYISDVEVTDVASEAIAIDAETFEVLRQLEMFGDEPPEGRERPSIDEVLDTIEKRLRRKLVGNRSAIGTRHRHAAG